MGGIREIASAGVRSLLPGIALATLLAACTGGTAASGGPSAGGSGLAASPLVGSWTTSITKADLAAAGINDLGLQNENSGRFTWTFARDGTWTSVQESLDGSPINSPVFRGTYTIDGQSLVATTAFPEKYRDSGLHYTFMIEGSSVRFDLLDPPDPIAAVVVETHPWTRS